jgi:hypothetical protein
MLNTWQVSPSVHPTRDYNGDCSEHMQQMHLSSMGPIKFGNDAGRTYLYYVANQLDLSTYGNGLDADGVKLYCAKVSTACLLPFRYVCVLRGIC